MHLSMEPPKFNADQRRRARECGFTEAEIAQVESQALPAAANHFKELARRDEIRKQITKVWRATRKRTRQERIEALERVLHLVSDASDASPLVAALNYMALAKYTEHRRTGGGFQEGVAPTDGRALLRSKIADHAHLEALADAAKLLVPGQQRRRREADPGPAREILYVVEPMGVTLSTNPTSRFWGIVGICYEVLLDRPPSSEAERAIKALAAWERTISA